MNTERTPTTSKAGPIILMVVGLGLAATTMFAVKNAYALRFALMQKEIELQKLRAATPPSGEDLSPLDSLRNRIAEFEAANQRLRADNEQLLKQAKSEWLSAAPTNTAPAAATNRLSWIERIRQDDPARYKQIMDERDQRRQQRDGLMQEQYARLDDRLKTAPTQDEVELINQLTATLQKMDELRGKWDALQQLTEDERQKQSQELRAESWQTSQTYRELRAQDRQLQLEHFAADLGYRDPKDVSAFVDSVQKINKETEASGRGMGFGRGGGGQPQQ